MEPLEENQRKEDTTEQPPVDAEATAGIQRIVEEETGGNGSLSLAMDREFFQLRRGERARDSLGGFVRPERPAGTRGLRDQAGVNEPLQRLVGGAVDDFQAHQG